MSAIITSHKFTMAHYFSKFRDAVLMGGITTLAVVRLFEGTMDGRTGSWIRIVKQARYTLIDGDILKLAGWSFTKSPVQEDRGPGGQTFGNCAGPQES
ncbi:hypothetical protein FQN54_002872 [Arachnomyces sp. PD_36]|nr:hypothetical protein FQN54_002872 [Arachnomyces sp. PD_36]